LPFQVAALCTGDVHFGVRIVSIAIETPPTGTLIQKHQRQETDVRYPPSIGPSIDVTPNTEPKLPMYFGRACTGTVLLAAHLRLQYR
jgi:hypothetical protein